MNTDKPNEMRIHLKHVAGGRGGDSASSNDVRRRGANVPVAPHGVRTCCRHFVLVTKRRSLSFRAVRQPWLSFKKGSMLIDLPHHLGSANLELICGLQRFYFEAIACAKR